MSTPTYVPYQAYKSKKHSRSFSSQKSAVSSSPSPPVHDSLAPQQPSSPQQYHPEVAYIPVHDGLPTITVPVPSKSPPVLAVNPASGPVPAAAAARESSQEPVSSPPLQLLVAPAVSLTPAPSPAPVAVSDARPPVPSGSTSTSGSTLSPLATRRTSTFRRIPSRVASTPVAPSRLRPGAEPRTMSLTSRHLDPSQPTRPPQSRLSTIILPGGPSPADSSQTRPSSRPTLSPQPQADATLPDRRTSAEPTDARPPSGSTGSVRATPSPSPSHTPATLTPIGSPSPSSTCIGTPGSSGCWPHRTNTL
ncbi:hypothetical protein BC834DRAFT_224037 [Gloeopeniophorella convolvens]|nr:hypothetical protein BC834DRAFT_224037 [Gloeopeniophorella convolvens]